MRTGRPKSENPRTSVLKARIDKKTDEEIMRYCAEHGVTRTDVVMEGLEWVLRGKKNRQ